MAEYIEREAAIKCAEESYKMWDFTMAAADGEREINKCYKMQELCKTIDEVFKIVPAADVAPVVHAHWLTWEEQFPGQEPRRKYNLGVYCSSCHAHSDSISPYCSICGAKMGEEEAHDR